MLRVSLQWPAAIAIGLLAGCAGHGTLPPPKPAVDVAREADEARRAYAAGDMCQAADRYQAIVDAQPGDADAWFRLGNARFRLQQPDDAVLAYNHAIQIRPGYPPAQYNLGVVRLKQAQAAMIASAQAGQPGDELRRDSARIAQRLSRVADDVGTRSKGDGGAPPFIVEPNDKP
ncbi:tetratricopeptide repeat protein [Luteibacter aegosomatissinici]|uniref:tetratricopeptide repeat protein n=1 Tax=Luteibacter aegosomatissinici TaxID=2911539 RepID=UPI001FFB1A70|nr:tetratricopeptide repeat protein [Luteibacter aegosomatissinici]UPG96212.1 tetratricopeptide repeat protein [Luteibacter aegosomatissinici]